MDFPEIFDYFENAEENSCVQNPERDRKNDDVAVPDQGEYNLSKIGIRTAEIQKEDEQREKLLEWFNFLKNQTNAVQETVDSFGENNDCHKAKVDQIEELYKEYFQHKYTTSKKKIECSDDDIKEKKLNILRDEIKVLRMIVAKKKKTSTIERELADLRAQKLILKIQMRRSVHNSSPLKGKNTDMQTSLLSANDEDLSSHLISSQVSSN